jgi:DNA-binding XRE family transcriptional regulator
MTKGLTQDEQGHVLAALRFLRIRVGNWKTLAKALGVEFSTMRNVKKGTNLVSVNMALKVSRLAEIPFDDVVAGKYPVKGMCPHCGRSPVAPTFVSPVLRGGKDVE